MTRIATFGRGGPGCRGGEERSWRPWLVEGRASAGGCGWPGDFIDRLSSLERLVADGLA